MTEGARGDTQIARAIALALLPVDRLLLVALAALAVIVLATHPQPMPLVAWAAALAASLVAAAAWGSREGVGRVAHDFAPLPLVVALFSLCGPAIEHANRARWDGALAALDVRLFGGLVGAWRNALGRPDVLTDLASAAYASYYFIPVLMAVALHRHGRRAEFQEMVFAFVATLLGSYFLYFFFPAYGPRVPHHLEAEVLGGGRVSAALREFINRAEGNRLDAFPSGHTALALVCLARGWRLFPRWRLPLSAAVGGIVFSTVYLSWHYAIDILAGAAFAGLVLGAMPLLGRTFGQARPPPRPAS